MVVGGTGLFPFSDLIDLLYKEQLMLQNPSAKTEIINLSPILSSNPFAKYNFEMLAAFNNVADVHAVTFQQLLFLAERGRLKITFKFKEDPKGAVHEGGNIKFAKKGFEDILSA
jgi:hypothetical protein